MSSGKISIFLHDCICKQVKSDFCGWKVLARDHYSVKGSAFILYVLILGHLKIIFTFGFFHEEVRGKFIPVMEWYSVPGCLFIATSVSWMLTIYNMQFHVSHVDKEAMSRGCWQLFWLVNPRNVIWLVQWESCWLL